MTVRLYLPAARLAPGAVQLDEADSRYLGRALRLRPGDPVTVFDGEGREADGRVRGIDAECVTLELGAARATARPEAPPVTLLVALLKGERMDLVVQKATELGAARIVPVAAARSVVRLEGERAEGRRQRWQRIARDAARQCGRADAPEVAAVVPLAEALASAPPAAFRLLLHEGEPARLRTLLPTLTPPEVVVATGPEGGFSPEEVVAARAAGFVVAGLGPRVLRAETAALAVLAILDHALAR